MHVLSGLLLLLLLTGCSSSGSASTSGSASPSSSSGTTTAASSPGPSLGPVVSGHRVHVDLTKGAGRDVLGITSANARRVLYYRPRGKPAHVDVVTNGGSFRTEAFQVSVTGRPEGSPAPSPNPTAPGYLLVLSHYDTAARAMRALRSEGDALGIDPQELASDSTPSAAIHGRPGGGVAVVVQAGPDPDNGGYQVNVEFGVP